MKFELMKDDIDLITKLVTANAKVARGLIARRQFDSGALSFDSLQTRARRSESLLVRLERAQHIHNLKRSNTR